MIVRHNNPTGNTATRTLAGTSSFHSRLQRERPLMSGFGWNDYTPPPRLQATPADRPRTAAWHGLRSSYRVSFKARMLCHRGPGRACERGRCLRLLHIARERFGDGERRHHQRHRRPSWRRRRTARPPLGACAGHDHLDGPVARARPRRRIRSCATTEQPRRRSPALLALHRFDRTNGTYTYHVKSLYRTSWTSPRLIATRSRSRTRSRRRRRWSRRPTLRCRAAGHVHGDRRAPER